MSLKKVPKMPINKSKEKWQIQGETKVHRGITKDLKLNIIDEILEK